MAQDKNIGLELFRIAAERPKQLALITEDQSLSYEAFKDLTRAFAIKMQDHGVGRGSICAVATKDTLVALSSILATSLLGAQWVNANRVLYNQKPVQPTHFFRSPETAGSSEVEFIEIDESWSVAKVLDRDSSNRKFPGYVTPDDPWIIARTSGTTGDPKFLTLSHQMMFDRSMETDGDFIAGETRFCGLFSCVALPFVIRALMALSNGCTIVDSRDPKFWTRAGVNLVMGSPIQVLELLGGSNISPRIPTLHIGGSKVPDDLVERMLQNFEEVIDVYGSSEANRVHKNVMRLALNGELLTTGSKMDSTVEIIDENGQPSKAGEVGTVRIRNGYTVKGYLNNQAAAERTFRDGWFYPGDFGRWGANGRLEILGRQDDVLNVGGVKLNALLIDLTLMSVPGIQDAMCFLNPRPKIHGEVLAFVVFEALVNQAETIQTAQKLCNSRLGYIMSPKRIFAIPSLPRGPGGEPLRRKCEAIVLERLGMLNSDAT